MNPRSALLPLAGLLAMSFSASAALSEMTEDELSAVSGRAYVLEYGRFERPIADLTERNVVVGAVDVSGKAREIETDYPTLTNLARTRVVTGVNAALVIGRTSLIAGVATVPGVGTAVAPILAMTPTPTIRFE